MGRWRARPGARPRMLEFCREEGSVCEAGVGRGGVGGEDLGGEWGAAWGGQGTLTWPARLCAVWVRAAVPLPCARFSVCEPGPPVPPGAPRAGKPA